MADRRVEDYAAANNCSNSEAKRRMGKRARGVAPSNLPPRGQTVPGTGKPKGE